MAEPKKYENTEPVDDALILLWLMRPEHRWTKGLICIDGQSELWMDYHEDGIWGMDARYYQIAPELLGHLAAFGLLAPKEQRLFGKDYVAFVVSLPEKNAAATQEWVSKWIGA